MVGDPDADVPISQLLRVKKRKSTKKNSRVNLTFLMFLSKVLAKDSTTIGSLMRRPSTRRSQAWRNSSAWAVV
jgi:hypothetical protein